MSEHAGVSATPAADEAVSRELHELASAVAYRLEQHGIMVMPVVDSADALVGVVHLHDLLRARVL